MVRKWEKSCEVRNRFQCKQSLSCSLPFAKTVGNVEMHLCFDVYQNFFALQAVYLSKLQGSVCWALTQNLWVLLSQLPALFRVSFISNR